jgi:hypothetical protein
VPILNTGTPPTGDVRLDSGNVTPVAQGARVQASGLLSIQSGASTPYICLPGPSLLLPNKPPGCSTVKIQLDGLDEASVPGLSSNGYADNMTITGTLQGTHIEVDGVRQHTLTTTQTPAAPCSPQARGPEPTWTALEQESAAADVDSIVYGAPDQYGGVWSTDGTPSVFVVEVVQGASPAVDFHALYPGPLCALSVANSLAVLNQVSAQIQNRKPDWINEIDTPSNRVRVTLPLIDQSALDYLTPLASTVELQPLATAY